MTNKHQKHSVIWLYIGLLLLSIYQLPSLLITYESVFNNKNNALIDYSGGIFESNPAWVKFPRLLTVIGGINDSPNDLTYYRFSLLSPWSFSDSVFVRYDPSIRQKKFPNTIYRELDFNGSKGFILEGNKIVLILFPEHSLEFGSTDISSILEFIK